MEEDQQQQAAAAAAAAEASGGASSQPPESENLPPMEAGNDPISATAAAAEAVVQVKAMEVQALADVLTRLNEKEVTMGALISRLENSVSAIAETEAKAAAALADIQAQQEAMKQQPKTPTAASGSKKGLAALLP